MGQLATRSPHRPNNLGLSLVQVSSWEGTTRRLHVRGLDLVHGTPVYDIKPCVPWDVPLSQTPLRVPPWVQADDALAVVTWSELAERDLQACLQAGALAPLYNGDSNKNNNKDNDDLTEARQMVQEILAQDPRSSHKGLKQNARGTATSSDTPSYNLILGRCQVFFRVHDQVVSVERIQQVDLQSATYVDGVPLIMAGSSNTNETK